MITTDEMNQLLKMFGNKIANEGLIVPDFPDWMTQDDANSVLNSLCRINNKGEAQIARMNEQNEADRKEIRILKLNNLTTDKLENTIRVREFAIANAVK